VSLAEIERDAADRLMNDLPCWFPLLLASGVSVPRTRIVRTRVPLIDLLDGKPPEGLDAFIASLRIEAERLHGPPVFLRTGQTSHKHGWRRTCYVTDLDALVGHVRELVEFSEIADMIGLPYQTWVLREFLDLDARFTAFDGMPVAVERRFFVAGGRVVCHHPYWPVEAIEGHTDEADWRRLLAETNAVTEAESATLLPMAQRVAEVFHDWSVDFARTKAGDWYAIDMALARTSYHWPDCEHAQP